MRLASAASLFAAVSTAFPSSSAVCDQTVRYRGVAPAVYERAISPTAVVAALTKAGFKLDGESDLYKRPDDPRTANVFDPAIRGKTDQFTLRFRKPE